MNQHNLPPSVVLQKYNYAHCGSEHYTFSSSYGIPLPSFRPSNKTGFSEDQWYYWFGGGEKIGSPNPDQIQIICKAFDWSPTYLFYGLGFVRLSEIEAFHASTKLAKQVEKAEKRQLEILSKLDELTTLLK